MIGNAGIAVEEVENAFLAGSPFKGKKVRGVYVCISFP
jgi:hypothetical protein